MQKGRALPVTERFRTHKGRNSDKFEQIGLAEQKNRRVRLVCKRGELEKHQMEAPQKVRELEQRTQGRQSKKGFTKAKGATELNRTKKECQENPWQG